MLHPLKSIIFYRKRAFHVLILIKQLSDIRAGSA